MTEEKPFRMAPVLKDKRIVVNLPDDTYEHLQQLAYRSKNSLSYLVHLAVLNMLLEDLRGELSFVPQFQKGETLFNA